MKILSIETSCDETAVAITQDNQVLSSIVSSQIESHKKYGGVVPELAGRHHMALLPGVVKQACQDAGVSLSDIDLYSACRGPGLAAALLIGMTAAKSYAFASDKPFVGIHHHEAHLLSVMIEHDKVEFPMLSLLVSGGHTMIVQVNEPGDYVVLGATIDDAAGEAYDKVARLLDLEYPGGPKIDKLAARGNPKAFDLPRPMRNDPFNTSFSGLKTAVKHLVRDNPDASKEDICASFQAAVVDSLMLKCAAGFDHMESEGTPAKAFSIGGGVAANSYLRQRAQEFARERAIDSYVPELWACTDNAAMIGVAANMRYEKYGPDDMGVSIAPSWALSDI